VRRSFWLSCGSGWSGVSAVVGGDGGLDGFYGFAGRLVEGFEGSGLDYAFTGALAASFYGVPRTTSDVDVLVAVAVYALFLFAVGSDFADGFISRKMGVDSKFGATLDAAVDFIFVNGMYLTFILKGIYSPWLLFLVIFMFAQFILTNFCFKKTIYDPVGKYYASLLFGGIGLTLLFPQQITYDIVTVGIAVSTVSVIISRLAYFLKTKA
jgi:phosphatidylglycerophosphate synthase